MWTCLRLAQRSGTRTLSKTAFPPENTGVVACLFVLYTNIAGVHRACYMVDIAIIQCSFVISLQ